MQQLKADLIWFCAAGVKSYKVNNQPTAAMIRMRCKRYTMSEEAFK
jgi:hypothetical protein